MCSDAHQWAVVAADVVRERREAGRVELHFEERAAPALADVERGRIARGAFVSLFGLQAVCGYEDGLQSAIPNHGAIDSSNQCVTSLPGVPTVGAAAGSCPSVSVQVTSFPDPGWSDRNGQVGLVVPDVVAVVEEAAVIDVRAVAAREAPDVCTQT